jgi:hypothetical protein
LLSQGVNQGAIKNFPQDGLLDGLGPIVESVDLAAGLGITLRDVLHGGRSRNVFALIIDWAAIPTTRPARTATI